MRSLGTYTDALKVLQRKGDSEGMKQIDSRILETKAYQDCLLALENDVRNGSITSL